MAAPATPDVTAHDESIKSGTDNNCRNFIAILFDCWNLKATEPGYSIRCRRRPRSLHALETLLRGPGCAGARNRRCGTHICRTSSCGAIDAELRPRERSRCQP